MNAIPGYEAKSIYIGSSINLHIPEFKPVLPAAGKRHREPQDMFPLFLISRKLEPQPHHRGNDLESPVDQVGGRLGRAEEAFDDHV